MELRHRSAMISLNGDVEIPALDWDGHSKISDYTRLKSNRFILNHKLSELCSFLK